MALDGCSSAVLANELNDLLAGARVDKIFQPTRYELNLILYKQGRSSNLFLSANPALPAAYICSKQKRNPPQAPAFCMLLRKYLLGATLVSVQALPWERIFCLRFQGRDELGDQKLRELRLEWMGKHSNLILLNQDMLIQDAIRHIDHSVNRLREIMPARPYVAPPSPLKLSPEALLREQQSPSYTQAGFAFLADLELKEEALQLEGFLLQKLGAFSPLLCREAVFRSGLDERLRAGDLSGSQRLQLSQVLCALLQELQTQPQATLYYLDEKKQIPYDYYALPLQHLPYAVSFPSLSQALDKYFQSKWEQNDFNQAKRDLERRLRAEQKQNARKLLLHREDMREGMKAEEYQHLGLLLQAQLHLLSPKAKEVTLLDYYKDGYPEITVALNPSLSPARNAESYFKRYRKAQHKKEFVGAFIQTEEAEASWLESLQVALATAESMDDLHSLKEEMLLFQTQPKTGSSPRPEEGEAVNLNPGKPGKKNKYLAPKGKNKSKGKNLGKKQGDEPALPPRRYLSSDGLLIEVGRNNLQNDHLSLKKARKDWLWLHVTAQAGAHVILHSSLAEVPDRSLEEAASIAAWYSQAGQGKDKLKVSVDYCPVRNLSKVKGAKPGQVIYKEYFSLYIAARKPSDFLSEYVELPS